MRSQPARARRRVPFGAPEVLERRALLSETYGSTFALSASGNGADSIETTAIASDGGTDRFVTGLFYGTANVDGTTLTSRGGSDVFVAKFDNYGDLLWARSVGGAGEDAGRAITVDASGNVYLTGEVTGTADFGNGQTVALSSTYTAPFVWKLDSNGNTVWATSGQPNAAGLNQGLAITVNAAGNVAIGGVVRTDVGFGQSSFGMGEQGFIAELNPNGTFLTAFPLAGISSAGTMTVTGLAFDPTSNDFLAVGSYTGQLMVGQNIRWNSDGGSSDPFVMKVSNLGQIAWYETPAGPGFDSASGLVVDSSGNVYVSGLYQQTVAFLAPNGQTGANSAPKLTVPAGTTGSYYLGLAGDGTVRWVRDLGVRNPGVYGATAPAVDSGDDYAVAVTYSGTAYPAPGLGFTSAGGTDVMLVRFTKDGLPGLATSMGGPGDDTAAALAVDGQGTSTVTGTFRGSADFGGIGLNDPYAATGAGSSVFLSAQYYWGNADDNFNGVGRSQPAVYRVGTGQWFAKEPGYSQQLTTFGSPQAGDIPVPGDYDGVGYTEEAYYRPSTAQWFVLGPTGPRLMAAFGGPGDVPVPADYDGIGRTEIAVFRPGTSQWFVDGPLGSEVLAKFGAPNLSDIPVPGNYDGVGHAEPAVFRPSTSQWIVDGPNGSHVFAKFGAPNLSDIPVVGNYDFIGRDEPAVFRPSTSQWIVLGPGGSHVVATYGGPNFLDIPADGPAGFLLSRGLIGPSLHATAVRTAPASSPAVVAAPAPTPLPVPVAPSTPPAPAAVAAPVVRVVGRRVVQTLEIPAGPAAVAHPFFTRRLARSQVLAALRSRVAGRVR